MMRPTKGDEIFKKALASGGKTAHDVLQALCSNQHLLKGVQSAMDEADKHPHQPGSDKAQAIRSAIVHVLTEEFVS